MIKYSMALRDWKTAELAAGEMTSQAKGPQGTAIAHVSAGEIIIFVLIGALCEETMANW
jgi:hypothetical protein